MSKSNYRIETNLLESQVETSVTVYLDTLFNKNSGMVSSEEAVTGADLEFEIGCMVYIQFKKSDALKSQTTSPIKNQKNLSKEQKIRNFRHSNNLKDNPSLFFKLRANNKTKKERKTQKVLQHNLLLSHNNPPQSYAFYVAPLIYKKKEFIAYMTKATRELKYSLTNVPPSTIKTVTEQIQLTNLVENHIAITPHIKVDTPDHAYSYSQDGDHACWHSGQILDQKYVKNLAQQLSHIVSNLSGEADFDLSLENHALNIRQKIFENKIDLELEPNLKPKDVLIAYGNWLKTTQNITLFLFHKVTLNNGTAKLIPFLIGPESAEIESEVETIYGSNKELIKV